jgi:phenylalanyl-tRNA synthetase beta chain
MQFPESWLREFCNPPLSTQQLADTLTMGGLEVEALESVAPPFTGVVVGEIKEAVQHPNADRLRVCQVDVGQGSWLSIVCGAPNARVGLRVACATVGAELPPGADGQAFQIKLGMLRGVPSQGMLCSAKELKIADDHGGLLELPQDAPLGQDIRQYLKLDDTLLTLKLTPNLAHCLSVYGIARELSALTGAPLKPPPFPSVTPQIAAKLAVDVQATDLCGRFSGRVLMGVNPQARTPQWLVDRLARCGQRSVTPLVDISNYVMFELGRPSHIFDLDKIHGGLQVRWGKAGESLKLLNGNTVSVDEKVGVIADDSQVESLAGIMGGDGTAVSDATQNIYIEAAFWWPAAIAGRSRRYNFSTDAGHRFERGVDPQLTVEHIERITQLVLDICGTAQTQVGPIDDQVLNVPVCQPVTLRVARANKVIGMVLSQKQCADALRALGLPVSEGDGTVTVTPPSFRFDLQIEEDLIEEVARMVGYNNLPTHPPLAPITAKVRPEGERSPFALRRSLAGLGYQETINFSFVEESWERDLAGNPEPIRLLNPIASQMSVMRSSLIGSLLQLVKFNADRKADRVRVFEVGRVFKRDARVLGSDTTVEGFDQPMKVSAMAWGPLEPLGWSGKSRLVDFFDVKADIERLLAPEQAQFVAAEHPALHPGRSAQVVLHGQVIGHVGELHPRWRQAWELLQAPVLFELDMAALTQRSVPLAQPVAKMQSVARDIAVIVGEQVTHAQLLQAIHSAATQGLLRHAVLFDIYRPLAATTGGLAVGEKSLAVRLTLHSDDATLTDAQIESAMNAVLASLSEQVAARLRS